MKSVNALRGFILNSIHIRNQLKSKRPRIFFTQRLGRILFLSKYKYVHKITDDGRLLRITRRNCLWTVSISCISSIFKKYRFENLTSRKRTKNKIQRA